jgi:hypothetical protein
MSLLMKIIHKEKIVVGEDVKMGGCFDIIEAISRGNNQEITVNSIANYIIQTADVIEKGIYYLFNFNSRGNL